METKEEVNIELEQIIEEAESRLKAFSEDELTKVSGGNSNGVAFEKGKWIEIDGFGDPRTEVAYELLELNGNRLLTNMWVKSGMIIIRGICTPNKVLPVQALRHSKEISRPGWAHE